LLLPWLALALAITLIYRFEFSTEARAKAAVSRELEDSGDFEFGRFSDHEIIVCVEVRGAKFGQRIYFLSDHDEADWKVLGTYPTFETCKMESAG
jgi:hypothetical protein